MTVLENSIRIQAPPETVWGALAKLDALDQYDPGVTKAAVLAGPASGLGAARQCDLAPGGWFRERVTDWRPHEAMAFELFEYSKGAVAALFTVLVVIGLAFVYLRQVRREERP